MKILSIVILCSIVLLASNAMEPNQNFTQSKNFSSSSAQRIKREETGEGLPLVDQAASSSVSTTKRPVIRVVAQSLFTQEPAIITANPGNDPTALPSASLITNAASSTNPISAVTTVVPANLLQIQELLTHCEWDTHRLSRETNIRISMIEKIIDGNFNVNLDILKKLATVFDVTIPDLFANPEDCPQHLHVPRNALFRIQELLYKSGLDIQQLSKQTNMSVEYLKKIKNGLLRATPTALQKIARVFGVSIPNLFVYPNTYQEYLSNEAIAPLRQPNSSRATAASVNLPTAASSIERIMPGASQPRPNLLQASIQAKKLETSSQKPPQVATSSRLTSELVTPRQQLSLQQPFCPQAAVAQSQPQSQDSAVKSNATSDISERILQKMPVHELSIRVRYLALVIKIYKHMTNAYPNLLSNGVLCNSNQCEKLHEQFLKIVAYISQVSSDQFEMRYYNQLLSQLLSFIPTDEADKISVEFKKIKARLQNSHLYVPTIEAQTTANCNKLLSECLLDIMADETNWQCRALKLILKLHINLVKNNPHMFSGELPINKNLYSHYEILGNLLSTCEVSDEISYLQYLNRVLNTLKLSQTHPEKFGIPVEYRELFIPGLQKLIEQKWTILTLIRKYQYTTPEQDSALFSIPTPAIATSAIHRIGSNDIRSAKRARRTAADDDSSDDTSRAKRARRTAADDDSTDDEIEAPQ